MLVYYVILLNSSDRNNAVYDLVLRTGKRFNTLFHLLVLQSIEVSYTYIPIFRRRSTPMHITPVNIILFMYTIGCRYAGGEVVYTIYCRSHYVGCEAAQGCGNA